MKKFLLALASVALVFSLAACNNKISTVAGSGEMQIVYEASFLAKEYATELLKDKLSSQGVKNYEIEQTAYGFATSEIPYVFVSFSYIYEDKKEVYGYKFSVNDGLESIKNISANNKIDYSNIFTIIDESIEIGKFSYPNG